MDPSISSPVVEEARTLAVAVFLVFQRAVKRVYVVQDYPGGPVPER